MNHVITALPMHTCCFPKPPPPARAMCDIMECSRCRIHCGHFPTIAGAVHAPLRGEYDAGVHDQACLIPLITLQSAEDSFI